MEKKNAEISHPITDISSLSREQQQAYVKFVNGENVFVTDGAFMASSSCVNPSLTYMAFTARAAEFAVNELKKGNL